MAFARGDVVLRSTIRAGDVDAIALLHGLIYSREYAFDRSFEAYVAGPLADFARDHGYPSVVLWTVSVLRAAAHLYRAARFEKVDERPGRHWGVDVVEERYELRLRPPDGAAR
jgi:hypothetical protein